MSYYQQYIGMPTSGNPSLIITNNGDSGLQSGIAVKNTSGVSKATRLDFWNNNVSSLPCFSIINDYAQTGTNDLRIVNTSVSDTNSVLTLLQSGNIGIGTTTPQRTLDMYGTMRVSGGTGTSITNFLRKFPPGGISTSSVSSTSYTGIVSGTSYGNGTYLYTTTNSYAYSGGLNNMLSSLVAGVATISYGWQPSQPNDINSNSDYGTSATNTASSYTTAVPYAYFGSGSVTYNPPISSYSNSNSTTYYGCWLQIQLPYNITLVNVVISPQSVTSSIGSFVVLGSTNGSTWTYLTAVTGLTTGWTALTPRVIPVTISGTYNYFRFIITGLSGNYRSPNLNQFYLQGYGTAILSPNIQLQNDDIIYTMTNSSSDGGGTIRMTSAFGYNYIQTGYNNETNTYAPLIFGGLYGGNQQLMILDIKGNIGIGTVSPTGFQDAIANPLNVTTASDTGAGATAITNMGGSSINYANSNRALTIFSEAWNAFAPMINLINRASSAYPQSLAEIHMGNTSFNGGIRMMQYGSAFNNMTMQFFMPGGDLSLPTDNVNFNYAVPRMSITRGGYVGIGTTNPVSLLHIQHITNEATLTVGNNFFARTNVKSADSGTYICSINTWGSATTYNALSVTGISYFNGYVGITTTTPLAPLHIVGYNSGGISLGLNTGNAISFDTNNSNVNQIGSFNLFGQGSKLTLMAGANGGQLTTYSGSWNQALTWLPSGYIGIGTTTPTYPLEVLGYRMYQSSNVSTYYTYAGGPWTTGILTYNMNAIGAHIQWGIWTESAFFITSDRRIKTNIIEADTSIVLNKILQLPIMTYNYIDIIEDGSHKVYGMISQSVQQVFPEAISIQTSYIPSIYKLATNIELNEDDNVVIMVDIPDNSELKVGGNVKLIIENIEGKYKTTVVSFTSSQLIVPKWEKFDITKKVFVYGAEIDDFHILDKPYLGIVCMGGIQELSKRNDTLSDTVNKQQVKIDTLEQQVSQILADNALLKEQVALLINQVNSIMSK